MILPRIRAYLDWRTPSTLIHACHDNCQQPLCMLADAATEIERLRKDYAEGLEAWRVNSLASAAEIERLLAIIADKSP